MSTELMHPAAAGMPVNAKARAIDPAQWHVLTTVLYKGASSEMILTLIDYCKARGLDPLKKPFHIVMVYDRDEKKMVESIWPSIGEQRITAMRTGEYAGKDEILFGPDVYGEWGHIRVTYPEWAQCTVYRMIAGLRVQFAGSRVYWLEAFASTKDGGPNSMWQKRPRGQLGKCAEAEALRSAFPEETGGIPTAEEMEGKDVGGMNARDITPRDITPRPALVDSVQQPAPPTPETFDLYGVTGEHEGEFEAIPKWIAAYGTIRKGLAEDGDRADLARANSNALVNFSKIIDADKTPKIAEYVDAWVREIPSTAPTQAAA